MCVVIGCLLIDLVVLIDSYRSMIMRFASPATRGFLSPLLSLSCLVSSRRKKTSGTRVNYYTRKRTIKRTLIWFARDQGCLHLILGILFTPSSPTIPVTPELMTMN